MSDRPIEPAYTTKASMLRRLDECTRKHWLGQRSQKASVSAVEFFIQQCIQLGIDDSLSVEQRHLDCYLLGLENRALSASTINTRMVAVNTYLQHLISYARECDYPEHLAKLQGLKVSYKTRKKQPKWHMTDDQRRAVEAYIASFGLGGTVFKDEAEAALVQDYIDWTFETGLRVEETLRLLWADFEQVGTFPEAGRRPALNVPGTKNEHSAVRIPISEKAASIILRRFMEVSASSAGRNARLFDISYERLGRTIWGRLREVMGVQDDPTSTLKALRRNFAVNALRKGLPARIIQELMRHSNLETTMSYLRVIGMSDNDETRTLLNRQINLGHDAQGNIQPKPPMPRAADHVPGDLKWPSGEPVEENVDFTGQPIPKYPTITEEIDQHIARLKELGVTAINYGRWTL